MSRSKLVGWGVMVAAFAVVGCGGDSPGAPKTVAKKEAIKKKEEGHSHGKGPNGGVVFDMGKYHAEFTVDHAAKECTVLFVTGDDKNAKEMAVAAKDLTLTTKETKTKEGKVVPPMTVKLVAKDENEGKAAKYVGSDPGIGNVADFEGSVTGSIDGKPSSGEFKE